MSDERSSFALSRIERALARIEAAASRPAPAPPPAPDTDELERLRAAHLALRERVGEVIGQIDALIGEGRS
jgi:hypothetical protein